ncbi:hypothetical protein GA0115246_1075710 [Streptomyces sp. SolWspMP-sol7th]|nr:hypothetical protein GA0115246_1075710 [Streptomyces sp. SolWspMP-sol7th]
MRLPARAPRPTETVRRPAGGRRLLALTGRAGGADAGVASFRVGVDDVDAHVRGDGVLRPDRVAQRRALAEGHVEAGPQHHGGPRRAGLRDLRRVPQRVRAVGGSARVGVLDRDAERRGPGVREAARRPVRELELGAVTGRALAPVGTGVRQAELVVAVRARGGQRVEVALPPGGEPLVLLLAERAPRAVVGVLGGGGAVAAQDGPGGGVTRRGVVGGGEGVARERLRRAQLVDHVDRSGVRRPAAAARVPLGRAVLVEEAVGVLVDAGGVGVVRTRRDHPRGGSRRLAPQVARRSRRREPGGPRGAGLVRGGPVPSGRWRIVRRSAGRGRDGLPAERDQYQSGEDRHESTAGSPEHAHAPTSWPHDLPARRRRPHADNVVSTVERDGRPPEVSMLAASYVPLPAAELSQPLCRRNAPEARRRPPRKRPREVPWALPRGSKNVPTGTPDRVAGRDTASSAPPPPGR